MAKSIGVKDVLVPDLELSIEPCMNEGRMITLANPNVLWISC